MLPGSLRAFRLRLLALLFACAGCGSIVDRNGRFELALPTAQRVTATFTAPSGRTIAVDGYPTPDGWHVRFSPREAGAYRYTIAAGRGVARGGYLLSLDAARPGPVRLDPGDPHRLVRDDGTTFWVLGENRINVWDPTWNQGHADAPTYIARMAREGMTTLRVFFFTDAHAPGKPGVDQLGCLEPRLGEWDERTARAFDAIFAAAEANGVQVILTVFAIGFTPGDEWRGWEDNPYNARNGGPARTPEDFFEDGAAIEAAKGRLRYVLARWGYSPNLMAVDLLNEPEWDGVIPEETWMPWANEMATWWHAHDPYGHLVTTGSVGLSWNVDPAVDERPWWRDPDDQIVQWHLYGKETYEVHALAAEIQRRVAASWSFGKPVLLGEFAWGGEKKPAYDHTHVGIWTTLFAGAGALAHSAPPFNIDSDEPMTPARAAHFRVLRRFLEEIPAPVAPAADVTPSLRGATALSLADRERGVRALWLLAPRAGYGRSVRGARITIAGVPAGRYRITWHDDVTGRVLARRAIQAPGGPLVVTAPRFRRHVAALLARRLLP